MKRRDSVARGALFTLAGRWADQLIGFVSTIILARLLVPDDIGIIAMASLVVSLVDVLLDLGVNVALIQNRDATQAHYDTAWTLRLAQTSVATVVVILGAPLAALYFKDARVEHVLQALAFSFLLSGLENIGIIAFQKEMTFGADFRFLVAKRIAGFAITIVAAWLLRSYWALVIGTLAGRAFGVVLSYFIHPMRPRLSLAKMREIFGISQWLMVRGIGNFVETNLHRFVVGGREPAAIMGAYSLADDIAKLPTATLLTPLNRVLFPAFVAAKNDLAELKRMFLLAQGVQALIGIPSAIGLTLVAREAVLVLLGERWIAAVPFVQLLSPVALIASITAAGAHVLLTLGHVRTLAYLLWIRIALFATAAYLVLPGASALDIAWLRGGFAAVTLAGFVGWARRYIPQLSAMEFARSVIRPLLAAAIMAGAVLSLHALDTTGMRTVTLLLVKIGVGALAYPLSVLLLWQLAGRPPGAESYLLDKLRRRG